MFFCELLYRSDRRTKQHLYSRLAVYQSRKTTYPRNAFSDEGKREEKERKAEKSTSTIILVVPFLSLLVYSFVQMFPFQSSWITLEVVANVCRNSKSLRSTGDDQSVSSRTGARTESTISNRLFTSRSSEIVAGLLLSISIDEKTTRKKN